MPGGVPLSRQCAAMHDAKNNERYLVFSKTLILPIFRALGKVAESRK